MMSAARRTALKPRNRALISNLGLVALGVILGCVLSRPTGPMPVLRYPSLAKSHQQPRFSLLVALNFTEAKYKKQFLDYFTPLAEYIQQDELDTVAYEVLLSDKDPLQVLVLERYKDKENSFLKTHRSSKLFLDYRPKMQAMMDAGYMTQHGESYIDSMIGFGDRVGT